MSKKLDSLTTLLRLPSGASFSLFKSPCNLFGVVIRQGFHELFPPLNSLSILLAKRRLLHIFAIFFASAVVMTLSAPATRSANEVSLDQGVPLGAMSFTRIGGGRGNSPQSINAYCDWFNVDGVDAMSNPTQVVAGKKWVECFDKQDVKQSVRAEGLVSNRCFPIAVSIKSRSPFPTRSPLVKMFGTYFDFGKKTSEKFAVDDARIDGSHDVSLTDIVVRLGAVLIAPFRAVSILPQTLKNQEVQGYF